MTTVSGTIYDDNGDPAAGRVVRAYRRDSGLLLGESVTGDGVDIPGDPDYSNVSLLLSFNKSPITDSSSSPKSVTESGSNGFTSLQKKFGPGGWEGGSDRSLSLASHASYAIATGDFTIEAWIRRKSGTTPSLQTLLNIGSFASGLMFRFGNNLFDIYINGAQITRSATMSNDVWYHVALCRSGTDLRFFLDGSQLGATITDASNIPQGAILIGQSQHVGGEWFNGYVDDLRFTRVARYTANFTPPTREFPATATDTPNPLGEYLIDCGSYTGEVQRIVLDDDAGTLYNDIIDRVIPG